MNLVQVGVQGVRQRSLERDTNRQHAWSPLERRMVPGDLDLAADQFAAARLGGQEDDQEVCLANLLLDLLCPRLSHRESLIDEDVMPGAREGVDDAASQGAVGF